MNYSKINKIISSLTVLVASFIIGAFMFLAKDYYGDKFPSIFLGYGFIVVGLVISFIILKKAFCETSELALQEGELAKTVDFSIEFSKTCWLLALCFGVISILIQLGAFLFPMGEIWSLLNPLFSILQPWSLPSINIKQFLNIFTSWALSSQKALDRSFWKINLSFTTFISPLIISVLFQIFFWRLIFYIFVYIFGRFPFNRGNRLKDGLITISSFLFMIILIFHSAISGAAYSMATRQIYQERASKDIGIMKSVIFGSTDKSICVTMDDLSSVGREEHLCYTISALKEENPQVCDKIDYPYPYQSQESQACKVLVKKLQDNKLNNDSCGDNGLLGHANTVCNFYLGVYLQDKIICSKTGENMEDCDFFIYK